MSIDIKNILINMLFIILPLFVYLLYRIESRKKVSYKDHPILATGTVVFTIIMCMSFPIVMFSPGIFFDLRHIPLILGTLYGGYRTGIWLILSIYAYRFFLGGDGVIVSFVVTLLIFALIPLLSSSYKQFTLRQKININVSISTLTALLIVLIAVVLTNTNSFEAFSITFLLIQALGMGITTYLVEVVIHGKIEKMGT